MPGGYPSYTRNPLIVSYALERDEGDLRLSKDLKDDVFYSSVALQVANSGFFSRD